MPRTIVIGVSQGNRANMSILIEVRPYAKVRVDGVKGKVVGKSEKESLMSLP